MSRRRMLLGQEDGEWTPADLTTLELWLDPTDISTLFQDAAKTTPVTSDADPVGNIVDKSPNALELTQGGTKRPTYKTGQINGVPAFLFSGAQYLKDGSTGNPTALFQVGADHSIYAVINQNVTATRYILAHAFAGWGFGLGTTANNIVHNVGAVLSATASGVTLLGRDSLLSTEFNNSADTSERYLDGVSKGSVTASVDPILALGTDRLTLGALANSTSDVQEWNGLIGEIIVTSSVDATDRTNIVLYLKTKYGIT